MTYKGYSARIEYHDKDGILFGQIAVIRDGVGFGAGRRMSGFGFEDGGCGRCTRFRARQLALVGPEGAPTIAQKP
ncbi:hypothetical protein [Breoghania sp. JC706]|uniref:hypothetical protein n=1 Tax=Breoghania sp. JC706 TaxID=3117732 RepID=UPI00300A35D4